MCAVFATPLALCVLLAGCGRLGYELTTSSRQTGTEEVFPVTPEEETVDTPLGSIPSDAVYISAAGSDEGEGTLASPLRTWSHALAQLSPGKTLVVLDGRYTGSSGTGNFIYDCTSTSTACDGAPCSSGTEDQPIVVRALNVRKPLLTTDGDAAPGLLSGCSNIDIYGLRAVGADATSASWTGDTFTISGSRDISFGLGLVAEPSRFSAGAALLIEASSDVLVEAVEVYDFHASGILVRDASDVTLRRNYVNARRRVDTQGGYVSTCTTRGDISVELRKAAGVIVENNILEGSCIGLTNRPGSGGGPNSGSNHRFVGNIVHDALRRAFESHTYCPGFSPCPDERIAANLVLENNVAVNAGTGFLMRGVRELVLRNSSAISCPEGFNINDYGVNEGVFPSASITTSLGTAPESGGEFGFRITDLAETDWHISKANVFGYTMSYDPPGINLEEASTVDPELGGCLAYVPPSSPLFEQGIGANVSMRYVDGELTSRSLWQDDGAFPCGSLVEGVNDGADSTCASVHERLHVGTAGCPLP